MTGSFASFCFWAIQAVWPVCRYDKYVPDDLNKKRKLSAKGAFEEYYVELIDQINTLNLVGRHQQHAKLYRQISYMSPVCLG